MGPAFAEIVKWMGGMGTAKSAVNIKKGLWLEYRSRHLEWNLRLHELLRKCPSDFRVKRVAWPFGTIVAWNDRVWGIECCITTEFGDYMCPQTVLRGVRINFSCPEELNSLPIAFRWLQNHLTAMLGPPASFMDDGSEHAEAKWHVGDLTLRHKYLDVMNGGHYVFLFLPRA